jgi:hypothetical protein
MPHLFREDNHSALATPAGMRPLFGGTNIFAASTGAATAEVDISTGHTAAAQNESAEAVVRVACIGSNAALVAFGAASAGASYTANTDMVLMAANSVEYWRILSTDVSFYHLQVSGSSTVQVVFMS